MGSTRPCLASTMSMLGLHKAMLGLHEAMLGLHKAMLGLHEAMFGLHEAMFGLHEAMLGLHKAMLGLQGYAASTGICGQPARMSHHSSSDFNADRTPATRQPPNPATAPFITRNRPFTRIALPRPTFSS